MKTSNNSIIHLFLYIVNNYYNLIPFFAMNLRQKYKKQELITMYVCLRNF
jgi:hypothetical protein